MQNWTDHNVVELIFQPLEKLKEGKWLYACFISIMFLRHNFSKVTLLKQSPGCPLLVWKGDGFRCLCRTTSSVSRQLGDGRAEARARGLSPGGSWGLGQLPSLLSRAHCLLLLSSFLLGFFSLLCCFLSFVSSYSLLFSLLCGLWVKEGPSFILIFLLRCNWLNGLPCDSLVKNLPAHAGDTGDNPWVRYNPWVRKIPWRRKWQLTPVFVPDKSHGQRSLAGYSPWGHKSHTQFSH